MGTFLLLFFLVIVIPPVTGAMLALVLREIHIRHPLPLGGTIGPRKPSKNKRDAAEIDNYDSEIAEQTEAATETSEDGTPSDDLAEESPSSGPEGQEDKPATTSFFDEARNIPENLPISNVLDEMMAETTPTNPDDFENLIEQSAKTNAEVLAELREITNDMDMDDLLDLENALLNNSPRAKIDFPLTHETGMESGDADPSLAKEVLGEHFDFDILEQQSNQAKQSQQPLELDIQVGETGTVQVSCHFMAHVIPQLADIEVQEAILPTFSSDWIQESGGTSEPLQGDPTQFCFTEEVPMVARKKKKKKIAEPQSED